MITIVKTHLHPPRATAYETWDLDTDTARCGMTYRAILNRGEYCHFGIRTDPDFEFNYCAECMAEMSVLELLQGVSL